MILYIFMRSIRYNKISFALTEIIQSNDHSIERMTRFISLYSLLRLINRSSNTNHSLRF